MTGGAGGAAGGAGVSVRGSAGLGAPRPRSCSCLCGAPSGLGTQARLRTRAESAISITGPAGQRPDAEPGGGGEGRRADREPGPLGCRCRVAAERRPVGEWSPARLGESLGRGRGETGAWCGPRNDVETQAAREWGGEAGVLDSAACYERPEVGERSARRWPRARLVSPRVHDRMEEGTGWCIRGQGSNL